MTQAAIAAVEAQPSQRSHPLITNFPLTRLCPLMNIITVMTGTATTPLITAVQYKALIGLIGLRVSVIPRTPAAARVE